MGPSMDAWGTRTFVEFCVDCPSTATRSILSNRNVKKTEIQDYWRTSCCHPVALWSPVITFSHNLLVAEKEWNWLVDFGACFSSFFFLCMFPNEWPTAMLYWKWDVDRPVREHTPLLLVSTRPLVFSSTRRILTISLLIAVLQIFLAY